MAKKNLARTAIEGGRVPGSRVSEHFHTRAERNHLKSILQIVKNDPEKADELVVNPRQVTDRKYREFRDKLGPVYRWLENQVGRPWDKIHSEIKAKFPANGLAGLHLLEHLNRFISKEWHEGKYEPTYGLQVDRRGILRDLGTRQQYLKRLGNSFGPGPEEKLVEEVNWLLDHGWHAELNRYLKSHHGIWVAPSGYRFRPAEPDGPPMPVRLLMGKHDVSLFVLDILVGARKEDLKRRERHFEWKTNLDNFIKRVHKL